MVTALPPSPLTLVTSCPHHRIGGKIAGKSEYRGGHPSTMLPTRDMNALRRPIQLLPVVLLAAFLPLAAGAAPSQPDVRTGSQPTAVLDEIDFGANESETSHTLKATLSETIRGGLDQPARRLLPGGPHPWEGGSLEWTMKVDPKEQNYVTVKLWGSDHGAECGRLMLFVNGLQAGYRHEGDYDILNQCDAEALAPGRFVYVTLPLPPLLTQGKTSLDLKIVALGAIWPYGATFEAYQKALKQPTRGIYRAYAHTAPRFVPEPSEAQGSATPAPLRSSPGAEVVTQTKQTVIGRLTRMMETAKSGKLDLKNRNTDLALLGEAYRTPWTPAFRNPLALERIVRLGDSLADEFAKNPKMVEGSWLGTGPLGQAVMMTWPDLGARLDTLIPVASGQLSRRQAWSRALKGSVDYWRTHRRNFTNQSMIVDQNLYTANRALQLIDPPRALPEAKALRYLYESCGLEPWRGSDTPGGGSENPFGAAYHLVSRKGISRELGYVGTYGETILVFARDMVRLTGDKKIAAQLRHMQSARLFFRYPGVDGEGFRCLKLASEIDNRTAHYPLEGAAYNSSGIRESWWMETAALFPDDSVIVGAAQQSVADGQYFSYIAHRADDKDTLGMMRNFDDWEKVSKLPPTNRPLPGTPGQPDFVFADEESAVLALKHRDAFLFVNFYYRAERGVNRVARVFEITPQLTRVATVRPEVEFTPSGETYERPDWIDRMRTRGQPPPGQVIHQAWAGEKLPIAQRPDDAPSPKYGDWGPFLGKASFYALTYGDFVIGINTTENQTFTLRVPPGHPHAKDLVTGKEVDLSNTVPVAPLSTVVLDCGG